MKKISRIVSFFIIVSMILNFNIVFATDSRSISINLDNLSYTENGAENEIVKYTQEDFDSFVSAYNAGSLPSVYVTEFIFDGVEMYAPYDLDDFSENGNDYIVEPYKKTVININTTGDITLSGTLKGGMIAVNTNGKTSDINIILNGVTIDTKDSDDKGKKCPAIYVYNKDITYTGCKVTIKTVANTKNYIEGGKFKKVSLVGSDEYDNYAQYYTGDTKTNYSTYSNYYKVYTTEQIKNVLFAKVQADSEDLSEGDPYYFYKGAGAISSDIDLYFEGTGYLEVKSKNKEGIETKGNLTFSGGTGDYVIYAEDDCLNTTTKNSSGQSARNSLTIDVKSMYAVVDAGEDSDEGDAIDSNGTLVINGGLIVAIAHPGQDAGIDSENGIYINGGTVFATGDMYDEVKSDSKQNFMVLGFQNKVESGTNIAIVDSNDNVIMSYTTDRTYTKLVYSSDKLVDGDYYVYKNGTAEGDTNNGFYTNITSYTKGVLQGYSSTGNQGGMFGGGQMPNGEPPTGGMPSGEVPSGGQDRNQFQGETNNNVIASNKKFTISGIANIYNGVADYTESSNSNTENSDEERYWLNRWKRGCC